MKISLKWLNDYVEVSDFFKEPQALADKLTAAGIEVEAIEDPSTAFQNVVVGYVRELGQHPDADRLTLCQVDVGEGDSRQIICGAKNHKQGDKVVAALPGAVLPGDFAIKKSKIRGVESHGMLCSEKELGLSTEGAGIIILPEDAPVGEGFAKYYGLDDVVLELSVTPNRADCLSHYGLAREIACLLGREIKAPQSVFKTSGSFTKSSIELDVRDSERCQRYAGRSIKGVKIAPSPKWLRQRLEAVGLNSINNVVDVTNFVMMEWGQPLHAFDVAQVEGSKIIVDRSEKGEKFTTLDGTEITLTGDELMIRDAAKPVALAGVVGGLNSGVTESTSELFIESAFFTAQDVRRTSRKFGIETDSAYRFSRGTDPEAVELALNRACQLIEELAGGEVADDHYDFYPEPVKKPVIETTTEYVAQRLGYSVSLDDFLMWVKRLGCQVEKVDEASGRVEVLPPTYRYDLNMDVDLVEEYGRLHGYDKIPETFPVLQFSPKDHDKDFMLEQRVNGIMVSEGYSQAVNYGFISSSFTKEFLGDVTRLKPLGLDVPEEMVAVKNPLNEELDVMRVSLLPGLFKNMLHNYRYGAETGRLFEQGFVFRKEDSGSYSQWPRLGMVAWGQKEALWQKASDRPVVFDLKTAVENLLERLQIQSYQWRAVEDSSKAPEFLHPGQVAGLFVEGRMLGFVGTLHPVIAQEHKLRHSVALAELDMKQLLRGQPRLPKSKKPSRYPAVERDLAFVIPTTLAAGQVAQEIKKAAGKLVQSVDVFDVYEGKNLPENHRSVAFRMLLQEEDDTMSEEQLQKLQEKVIQSVSKKLGVEVR